jgi:hypothetical protein
MIISVTKKKAGGFLSMIGFPRRKWNMNQISAGIMKDDWCIFRFYLFIFFFGKE